MSPRLRRLLLLAGPAPLLVWGAHRHLETEGRAHAARLGAATTALSIAAEAPPGEEVPREPTDPEPPPAEITVSGGEGAHPERAPRRNRPARGAKGAVHAIVVDRSTVLRLASAQIVPRGVVVRAAGARPAGIRLTGATALGVGVVDGDVLTDVAGQPVQSSGDVVALVLAALSRGAPSISARFYRGQTPWSLVVELPQVQPG